jgi:hypothetical protein
LYRSAVEESTSFPPDVLVALAVFIAGGAMGALRRDGAGRAG